MNATPGCKIGVRKQQAMRMQKQVRQLLIGNELFPQTDRFWLRRDELPAALPILSFVPIHYPSRYREPNRHTSPVQALHGSDRQMHAFVLAQGSKQQ